jgi:type II secretory pathway pseudopilin PulG
MKTFLVAAALALTTFSTFSASANNRSKNKVSVSTFQSLQEQFGDISNLNWEPAINKMLRATFTKDGETVSAFFDQRGQLLASTTNVEPAELPGAVKKSLAQKVKEGTITEAIRYQDNDEQAFFIKIVAGNTERLFKCYSEGAIEEVKF